MPRKTKELSFDEALNKLEETAELLSDSDTSIEEGIKLFDKSIEYYNFCNEYIKSAKQKIQMLDPQSEKVVDFDEQ